MRNVLLLVHDDAGQNARLEAALDLTRALDGHLLALSITTLPAVAADPYWPDSTGVLLADEHDRGQINRARVEERLLIEDVSWSMTTVTGHLAPSIEAAAGLADLIVVNCQLDGSAHPDMRALVADLLARTTTPVVAVPPDAPGFNVSGRALVAWDGSPACAAALRAATPLLRQADSVILLEIDDGSLQTPALEAATYLSRHDVNHPLIRIERAEGRTAGDVLMAEIADRRCDYLVMGGFGHGRFIQALFGGVTRRLLGESPVPLVLAHG